jgi:hypothetical protein
MPSYYVYCVCVSSYYEMHQLQVVLVAGSLGGAFAAPLN